MPVTVNCPSCGGDVTVASPASRTACCPYCQSTLIVNEQAVRLLGKMALLAETPSCLAVGWPARCLGKEIRVLGRLQYRYDAGLWDEWWIEFAADGSHAWISQDEGEYMFEKPYSQRMEVPKYNSAKVGDRVRFGDRELWVEEKNTAEMVGMQGEIPLDAAPGKPMRYLDLTDNKIKATVEYFDDGSHLAFRGKYLKRSDLQSDIPEGFRQKSAQPYAPPALSRPEGPRPKIVRSTEGLRPQTVNCPNCGGTVTIRDRKGVAMAVCAHCNSALDVAVPGKVRLLYKAKQRKRGFPLEIGATGTLHGVEYIVTGIVVSREDVSDGIYEWVSFQLFNPEQGYAFLELENGHWLLFKSLKHPVKFDPHQAARGRTFSYRGQKYKVFERSAARVVYVEGELSWVARLEDRNEYMDAIRPPHLISAEWTKKEIEWSLGTYTTSDAVGDAFKIPDDKRTHPRGIAPAQPFKRSQSQRLRSIACVIAAALLVVLVFVAWLNQGTVIMQARNVPASDYLSETGFVSDPFEIPEGTHISKLSIQSNGLSNTWVATSVAILDENETVVLDADAIVEEYHGHTGGESWREGSQSDYTLLRLTGPGIYRLNVFGASGSWSPSGGDRSSTTGPPIDITLETGVVPARYFLIAAIVAAIYPIWSFGRKFFFEARRWPNEED